ncbi:MULTISPECIES: SDR family oxidoreductase [Pseudomonas]|uniref:SDR family oxidoreductase n=1 Tax=Pseudomonas syringae pv. papulans TaxID=83963 RepID=A0A0P9XGF3_PSESX|nr:MULTISPECIES: SDR family oxidoreductase [Pseudomonas]MDU8600120.1 SDR family oxidoreductase [Pseudomonas syringae]KPY33998.1 Short-chain dehydrogenase/reductase SDR [Pseudomonas syringae pv. papulans]KWS33528.1 oxidoreductase [Pseudomonas syringae pv. papulans]MCK9738086.1 SDR family oxidoreductase [Pseudomonas syringae pv. syringae]MDA7014204.1 SDR family oxidoreductase [Pseudomonas cerasi]
MSNIQGKVVLITGASSGIGEAAARLIAAKGAHVVLGARRIERLQTLAADIEAQGGSARFRALDVTDALDMQAFADFATHAFGKIDVIINNAGVMPLSPLAALNIAEWNQMLDVNVRGVLHGIAAVLPSMQAQGHGQIINISSIGGLAVSPTAAVYCATKFAVRAISDGLRQETDKIRVTVVCPGVVESELADSISDETAREAMKAFRKVALEPDAIARALVYAIEQPDGVDVSEIVVRPTGSAY